MLERVGEEAAVLGELARESLAEQLAFQQISECLNNPTMWISEELIEGHEAGRE